MRFGFSYTGLVFLLMLFIPNIIWTRKQPQGYTGEDENKILLVLERTGQVLTSVCAMIFSDFNIHKERIAVLIAASALMVLYEIWWVRYFRDCTLKAFYSSLLGIPIAGATLPVAAFFLLGVYGLNIPMLISSVILGIGHIGIHAGHKKNIQ